MKCSLGISNFLEEISSLSHSVLFLYFFALIAKEGFLISSCYSLKLCIQMLITVIQVYAPTSNAEEAEVEQFYEDLQDILELTPRKDVLFIIGDWNAKVGS